MFAATFISRPRNRVSAKIVGIKKLGEPVEMLLSHPDPYQRMIDVVTTGGRPLTIKYLPPFARRDVKSGPDPKVFSLFLQDADLR